MQLDLLRLFSLTAHAQSKSNSTAQPIVVFKINLARLPSIDQRPGRAKNGAQLDYFATIEPISALILIRNTGVRL